MDGLDHVSRAQAMEVISFLVEGQEFCVDIGQILEIRGWTPATPVAHAPDYLRGVINLRGAVMPVIDLGVRIGHGPLATTERSVIIVAQVSGKPCGFLVDAVCDTLVLDASQIQTAHDATAGEAPPFVVGFLPLEDRMVTVLRLDEIVSSMQGGAAAMEAFAA